MSWPHTSFSGCKAVQTPNIDLPKFLPDTPEVRSDFLDYLTEVEWFDRQVGQMLDVLEQAGELENTLIIVTADDGMPMLRAKATCFEYGLHVPLAISWPKQVPAGRTIDDPVGFVDLHATILAACESEELKPTAPDLAPVGRNLLPLLKTRESGLINPKKAYVFAGHERYTLTRYNDIGYPIRALRTPQYLYLRNLCPDRYPVGDPRRVNKKTGQLLPLHAGCYRDIDDQVTLKWLVGDAEKTEKRAQLFELIVGRHPAEELYDVTTDPDCLKNLASDPAHQLEKKRLASLMDQELKNTLDSRLYGVDPDIADKYLNVNLKNLMGEGNYPPPHP